MPDVFASLPLTDAQIAGIYCAGDFALLAPRCEAVASGADGAIAAASFALTSATPFAARGVQPGHVLVISHGTRIDPKTGKSESKAVSDTLPVLAAADGGLTLGRFGYQPGQGALPAGVTETTGVTGLSYHVASMLTQIQAEYANVCRQLGIASSADLLNNLDVQKITALEVLRDLYNEQSRDGKDDWASKRDDADGQIKSLLESLRMTYSDSTTLSRRPQSAPLLDDFHWRPPSAGHVPDFRRRWDGGYRREPGFHE